jgi:hypothetical protein
MIAIGNFINKFGNAQTLVNVCLRFALGIDFVEGERFAVMRVVLTVALCDTDLVSLLVGS